MISARATLILLCCVSVLEPVLTLAAPERSVSTSRQFIVYGPELRLRGAICDLAERTKREFLQLVDQRDEWNTAIVINVQYPQANIPETPRAALSFSQTGFGLKLQLNLNIGSSGTNFQIRRELLRTILLELIYRREPSLRAGTAYVAPPEWLLDGVATSQSDSGSLGWFEILAVPANSKKVLPLEEFLRQHPDRLDAPGHLLYRAYSLALVELLVRGSDGRHRLARFIADLPAASSDPMADLRAHFPEIFDAAGSAETRWTSFIAGAAIVPASQFFDAEETGQSLERLLHLNIAEAGSERWYGLDEFANFVRRASSRPALAALSRQLRVLAARAHPIYRPLILEYADLAALLAGGKTKQVGERLAQLGASRQSVVTRLQEIDDYMNWFEATKSSGLSGAFDDYMKAAELGERREQTRRDPISLYLDALETEFQN